MSDELNLHALAREFCGRHRHCELAAIEAAMNIGAIAATEHAIEVQKRTRQQIKDDRDAANRSN